jgi:hypothetical protein
MFFSDDKTHHVTGAKRMANATGRFHTHTIALTFCLFALITPPALSTPTTPAHTTSQTLALIQVMGTHLEAIRIYMGKAQMEIARLDVENAAAHETYYQAVNLYRKADRLALEIIRSTRELEYRDRSEDIGMDAVYAVVEQALQRVDAVAADLGIDLPPAPDEAPTASVSDVYEALLNTGQRINQLLERQFSPSDVYQQVTKALNITLALFDRFPGERRVTQEPEWTPGKKPGDVYQVLLDCHAVVRDIAQRSGIDVLALSATPKSSPYRPGEVYDIATLLVSELNYIYAAVPGLSQPAASYFPGRKFPSDVHQRARRLHQTLIRLDELIARRPGWRQTERG